MTPTDTTTAFDSKVFLKQVPKTAGVYRMFDANDDILYVGKAKNLKNRVGSYFQNSYLAPKTRALVAKIARMEVTLTSSETEALLLEQNQIKSLKPPYNILLRDDKTYPYIYLASDKAFPSISMKRVRQKGKVGDYYGPYPSAGSVKESLSILEKLFKVRQCDESFYKNRSRPCLQYQIKRCKAPCVGLVEQEEYLRDVEKVDLFLKGKQPELIRQLMHEMEDAAKALDYEHAAELRDQIQNLRHVQETQAIESGHVNCDAIAMSEGSGCVVVSIIFVRQGSVLGHKNYFPKLPLDDDPAEKMQQFLEQFYIGQSDSRDFPQFIVSPAIGDGAKTLGHAIESLIGKQIKFQSTVRGAKAKWRGLAQTNADNALQTYLSNRENIFQRFEALRRLLNIESVPKRIECFDISHSSGEKTVASCVVFNEQGPLKSDYRIYNIEDIKAADDYAAMDQVLRRRLKRIHDAPEKKPDIIFIDGGKGQLNIAVKAKEDLDVQDVMLVGVAKGSTRKAGFETLLLPDGKGGFTALDSDANNPALHLIQHLRDESHRFAISGHRYRRDKARKKSLLEGIEGIGPKRRRELIKYFGSAEGVKKASISEISKVEGISEALAETIYTTLHH